MVLGTPDRIVAISEPAFTGVDGQTSMLFSYASGAQAILNASVCAKSPTRGAIVGTDARIEIDGDDFYAPNSFTLIPRDGEPTRFEIAHRGTACATKPTRSPAACGPACSKALSCHCTKRFRSWRRSTPYSPRRHATRNLRSAPLRVLPSGAPRPGDRSAVRGSESGATRPSRPARQQLLRDGLVEVIEVLLNVLRRARADHDGGHVGVCEHVMECRGRERDPMAGTDLGDARDARDEFGRRVRVAELGAWARVGEDPLSYTPAASTATPAARQAGNRL